MKEKSGNDRDKNTLLSMADNPNFIPGIYNYCDRWCERCPFTLRCMVYAMEKEAFPDQKSRDINNKEFWQKIQQSLVLSNELLRDMAKARGIDLPSVLPEEMARKRRMHRKEAEQTPIARQARLYSIGTGEWFERHEQLFKMTEEILTKEARLGIKEPELTTVNILEAVEVIRWYQDQIWVKLMRALHGEDQEEELDDDELQDFPKDSDGSAKVALIGIDRSIGAWTQLSENLEDQSGSILDILANLGVLRMKVEERFPRARSFVRPGFDQEI
ncbi:MAG: hypothetical protein HW389_3457 [Bacteroidetes bacterium]|nr:hypothetical protein [Bacteroidota bacterium]